MIANVVSTVTLKIPARFNMNQTRSYRVTMFTDQQYILTYIIQEPKGWIWGHET